MFHPHVRQQIAAVTAHRPGELPKSESTQPRCTTINVTLYSNDARLVPDPDQDAAIKRRNGSLHLVCRHAYGALVHAAVAELELVTVSTCEANITTSGFFSLSHRREIQIHSMDTERVRDTDSICQRRHSPCV